MGNILEKKCLNYCCFATFSVGVEWLDQLRIKPTQPQFKFKLKLGLSQAKIEVMKIEVLKIEAVKIEVINLDGCKMLYYSQAKFSVFAPKSKKF